ncbi:MDR family MFS transporter [Camelliibacillus cellulosilyticus]|uniref:MDR family MFS transporter n=1 Tax=Camelliibacillus cellulosilyticus TaxID=2174486 RepID=A0ABV9GH25_9BACL
MLAMMVSTFLAAIEGTIVSTAMPIITGELQGIKLMNWVFSVFLLLSAVTVPIFGKLSDLFGRKKIFLVGTIVFMVGSGLCGLSQTMEQLIIFRVVQGIGAGALLPVTATIVADIYPYEKRAQMMGYLSLVWGVAGVFGPLVGGFFVDQLTWRWIFYMNVPFGLITIFMVIMFFKEELEIAKKRIDYLGAVTFSIGTFLLLFAFQIGGEKNEWLTPTVGLLIFGALVIIGLFLYIETKVKEPLIPLSLFKIRSISVGNTIGFFMSAVLIGIMVYIPMWVQGVLGYGATVSGLILAPMSVLWTVGSFLSGKMLLKSGVKLTNIVGIALFLITALWLAAVHIATPQTVFYFISALQGIAFGLIMTSTTVTVQSAVGWSERGVATASNTFFRNLGQTIGVALLGTFFNAKIAASLRANGGAKTHQEDALNQLLNPQSAAGLSAGTRESLRHVLVGGIHGVFIILFAITVVALALAFALPKKEQIADHKNRGQ